jgi:hypothetical protein
MTDSEKKLLIAFGGRVVRPLRPFEVKVLRIASELNAPSRFLNRTLAPFSGPFAELQRV